MSLSRRFRVIQHFLFHNGQSLIRSTPGRQTHQNIVHFLEILPFLGFFERA